MQHSNLAAGKWQNLSLYEQMGNIGSEVDRVIRSKEKDQIAFENAITRALELIDLTISAHSKEKGLIEIVRVRELFCAAFLGSDQYKTSLEDLNKYFMQFALAARLNK